MSGVFKLSRNIAIFLLCLDLSWQGAKADGVGDFLIEICNEYPHWLSLMYPDPSPPLDPLQVTIANVNQTYVVNASFSNYQMFNHSNPENWKLTDWNVDLTTGYIAVMFEVRNTKFGGKYTAEGIYEGVNVTGQGTWNITTPQSSYLNYILYYWGAQVTEDEYIDLVAGGHPYTLYYYVPSTGGPLSVREMDGLVAGGDGPEKLLKDKLFDGLEIEAQYRLDHPLTIPLHTYLTVMFASTPIPEMRNRASQMKSDHRHKIL